MAMKKFSGMIGALVTGQLGYFSDSASADVDVAALVDYPVGTATSAYRLTVHLSALPAAGEDLQFDLYNGVAPVGLPVTFTSASGSTTDSVSFAPVAYAGSPTFETFAVVVTTPSVAPIATVIRATITVDFI